ncbi:unnamed protein product [Dovyalis caffra]|uniref:Uncharacterized protein n=1 Tax=Dovyalis caffra TaxID=77055 RepID=A0AAV1QV27_9ROSI|nr:unnamed protein product [Dovyalis caffra]
MKKTLGSEGSFWVVGEGKATNMLGDGAYNVVFIRIMVIFVGDRVPHIKRRLAYPNQNLEAIPIPSGQNATGKVWNFKLSVRARGRHRKPVIIGEWLLYVRKKGLVV